MSENSQKTLAKSLDGGVSWNTIQQGVEWNDFDAKSTELMAIENLKIFKSTDGGITFQNVYTETFDRTWRNILFFSDNTWIAAGYTEYYQNVRFLRTTDDGNNWNLTFTNFYQNIEHLKKNSNGLIFCYGYVRQIEKSLPQIYYSSDTGQRWQADNIQGWIMVGYNENYRVRAAYYLDENYAFAYTMNDCVDNELDFGRMNTIM